MTKEFKESNLAKSLPTRFVHGGLKILEWKWFNSRTCVGVVLTWDLHESRLRGFIGSSKELYAEEEEQVREIADWGCTLPTDMVILIFKRYFSQPEVIQHLDKDFRLFMTLTDILNEKS